MKYYSHNVGDWLPATVDLSAAQEGIYRRLMDWYYSNELPLPLTFKDINKIARCRNPAERDAVKVVVARYFVFVDDGWHNEHIDSDLKRYAMGSDVRTRKRDLAAQRQARSRQKRDATWAALLSKGVQAPFKATQSELDALLVQAGVTLSVTRDEAVTSQRDLAGDGAVNQEPRAKTRDAVAAVTPRDDGAARALDRVGMAGKALKQGGFALPNVADPRFLALLQAGITDDELRLTASEATARGKSWGWLLATLAGRRADAVAYGSPKAANGSFRRDPDRVAGLTPTIAAKPAKPGIPF